MVIVNGCASVIGDVQVLAGGGEWCSEACERGARWQRSHMQPGTRNTPASLMRSAISFSEGCVRTRHID